ncbi:MAG: hypothetical protein AAGD18_03520 [Actinomycetota bacterium]
MAAIAVEFLDESYPVDADAAFTFGRHGDLIIDDANPYMHRTVGAIARSEGLWTLRNLGRTSELHLLGSSGKRSQIPPDGVEALLDDTIDVRFTAGPSTYEFRIRLVEPPELELPGLPDAGATATSEFGVVALNDEQRRMLAAFAAPRLLDPASEEVPANAAVAGRLGWSGKKLDRKLDYLCRRLTEHGVRGLRGQIGEEAVDRRRRLVDHAILARLVTTDDLGALDR